MRDIKLPIKPDPEVSHQELYEVADLNYHLAMYDNLGLPSLNAMLIWAKEEYVPSRSWIVMAVDIANFGDFNNIYGQAAGDVAIRGLAQTVHEDGLSFYNAAPAKLFGEATSESLRIKSENDFTINDSDEEIDEQKKVERTTDTIGDRLFRIGGDEFLLFVDADHKPASEIDHISNLVKNRVQKNFDEVCSEEFGRTIKLRFGIIVNEPNEDVMALIKRAYNEFKTMKTEQKQQEMAQEMAELAIGSVSFS